jgi:hypothetical protein
MTGASAQDSDNYLANDDILLLAHPDWQGIKQS